MLSLRTTGWRAYQVDGFREKGTRIMSENEVLWNELVPVRLRDIEQAFQEVAADEDAREIIGRALAAYSEPLLSHLLGEADADAGGPEKRKVTYTARQGDEAVSPSSSRPAPEE